VEGLGVPSADRGPSLAIAVCGADADHDLADGERMTVAGGWRNPRAHDQQRAAGAAQPREPAGWRGLRPPWSWWPGRLGSRECSPRFRRPEALC